MPGVTATGAGAPQCTMDGMLVDCEAVGNLMASGAAAGCPDNNCGPRYDPHRDGRGRGGWEVPYLTGAGFIYEPAGPSGTPAGSRAPTLRRSPGRRRGPGAGDKGNPNEVGAEGDGGLRVLPVSYFFVPLQKQTVRNATQEQQELINSGIAKANEMLDIKPCAAFFDGKEKGIEALKGLRPYIDPNMDKSGHPQGEMRKDGLAINPHGSSFVTPNDGSYKFYLYLPGTYAKYTLTLDGVRARAFAFFHEGGHGAGVFGPTDNDSLDTPATFLNGFVNNYKVWKACFSDVQLQKTKELPPYPGVP